MITIILFLAVANPYDERVSHYAQMVTLALQNLNNPDRHIPIKIQDHYLFENHVVLARTLQLS